METKRLTFLDSYARYLSFSPDGSQIVFTNDRHVFTVNSDGSSLTQLTFDPGIYYVSAFSPDGSKIAYVDCTKWPAIEEQFLCVMNADGSDARQLTDIGCVGPPVFAPDGGSIVFSYRCGDGISELYRIGIDGSNLMRLTRTPVYQGRLLDFNGDPTFSSDGEWIYYISSFHEDKSEDRDEIRRIRPDGTESKRLSYTGGHVTEFRISLDGETIAFETWLEGERYGDDRNFIWVMDANGGNQKMLFTDDSHSTNLSSVSPDGKWFAISLNMSPNGYPWDVIWTADIYLLNSENGELRRLTNTGSSNRYPMFSPDGNSILFSSDQTIDEYPVTWDSSPGGCSDEGRGDLYMLTDIWS